MHVDRYSLIFCSNSFFFRIHSFSTFFFSVGFILKLPSFGNMLILNPAECHLSLGAVYKFPFGDRILCFVFHSCIAGEALPPYFYCSGSVCIFLKVVCMAFDCKLVYLAECMQKCAKIALNSIIFNLLEPSSSRIVVTIKLD